MNHFKQVTEKGYTLIEVIVVTVLVGILAAMGTTSWFGYFAKYKLNDTNEQLYNILINTQQKAIKENLAYTIALQQSGLIPQYKIYPKQTNINTIPASPAWQDLVKDSDNMLLILNDGSKLVFDYEGKIDKVSEIKINEKVTLQFQGGKPPWKRCITVKTIFGYLYTASDDKCD